MVVLRIIIIIILAIFAIGLLTAMINLFSALTLLFREKTDDIKQKREREFSGIPSLDLLDRTDLTTAFLNLINVIIDNEIIKLFESYSALRKKYEVIRMDEDISNISTLVFKSIKPEIIRNKELVLTDTYIMQFITQSTSVKLLEYAQSYNARIINERN